MASVVTKSSRVIAVAFVLAALPTAASATSTAAHAMVVSGIASHPGGPEFACATSGPQPMEQQYFGSVSNGLPTEGYGYCHLAGGIQDTTNPAGISTANETVSHAFDGGVHNQTSAATADFGVLHAVSKGSFTGSFQGGFTYAEGEASAYSTDTLPVPVGAVFLQFGLTVDGSAAVTGSSQILSILDYQINGGIIYGAFEADLIGTGFASVAGLDGTGTNPVAGFTVLPGSLTGSGTVTSFRTAISGSTFDLTLALLAASYPGYGGSANVDFSDTARLSSLGFLDAAGNPIAFGTLTGASGRLYDASGVHTAVAGGVPEPAAWALMVAGFGLVGASGRRSRARAA